MEKTVWFFGWGAGRVGGRDSLTGTVLLLLLLLLCCFTSNRKIDVMSGLVGCFGFNGPLRQYFSVYQAVSQREEERAKKI